VVNRDGHLRKTTSEACDRAGAKGSPLLSVVGSASATRR
jgi:hypothetical protein